MKLNRRPAPGVHRRVYQKKVLIETDNQDLVLQTRTKVYDETSDCNVDMINMQTKTRVHQENDDAHIQLLGMAIKTYVKQERDDESDDREDNRREKQGFGKQCNPLMPYRLQHLQL